MPRTLLTPCLDPNDVTASQEVGEFLRSQGVQAIMFPSAIPGFTGQNVVVFCDATPPLSRAAYEGRRQGAHSLEE
jgi:RES domain